MEENIERKEKNGNKSKRLVGRWIVYSFYWVHLSFISCVIFLFTAIKVEDDVKNKKHINDEWIQDRERFTKTPAVFDLCFIQHVE